MPGYVGWGVSVVEGGGGHCMTRSARLCICLMYRFSLLSLILSPRSPTEVTTSLFGSPYTKRLSSTIGIKPELTLKLSQV